MARGASGSLVARSQVRELPLRLRREDECPQDAKGQTTLSVELDGLAQNGSASGSRLSRTSREPSAE